MEGVNSSGDMTEAKSYPKPFERGKQLKIILLLTVLFGFIFRLVNSYTHDMPADPAHFVINAKNFLDSGLLVLWGQSTYLWYAFTDIFYKLFGITQFSARFSSVLLGTMTILVMYLFVKEFSENKRIALVSAVLYAFVPTFIFNSSDEQDISVLFFIVLIFYFLIKGLNDKNNKYLLLSGVAFGVASMWKAYVPILIVPWLGFIAYYHLKVRYDIRKNFKILIYVILIILVLVSPVLVYNYLNVKHNDVPTFFFAKFFSSLKESNKVRELYGWVGSNELYMTNTFLQRMFISYHYGDPLQESTHSVLYYGITTSLASNGIIAWGMVFAGLVLMYLNRKKERFAKDYFVFFMLYFPIPFIFLLNGNFMFKHYIHFLAFGLPIIAYAIDKIYIKFEVSKFLNKKNLIYVIFILIVLFEFFVVLSLPYNNSLLFSRNTEGQFIDYKIENIPKESFIIYDDRIYNSLAAWILNDRYYVSVNGFGEFSKANDASNFKQNVPVYIVECVTDDCGWGTIKNNPDLNKSMENFFDSVKEQEVSVDYSIKKQLKSPNVKYYNPFISEDKEQSEYIRVYKTNMLIDLNLAKQFKMQYSSFMYPVGYENKELPVFKNFVYTPEGSFEELINNFAWSVFYLNILLSFIAIFWVIVETYIYI